MSTIRHAKRIGSIVIAVSAGALLTGTPHVAKADFLPVYGGPTDSASRFDPIAVNDAGVAVGHSGYFKYNEEAGVWITRAFRWNAFGAAELGGLGTDPEGETSIAANAVNAAGAVVGLAHKYDASGNSLGDRAVRWDAAGTSAIELAHLGTDPSGITASGALAINGAGAVVGFAAKYDGLGNWRGSRAVRWDSSGAVTELAITGIGENDFGHASAAVINSAGTGAGWVSFAPGSPQRAARWEASGTAATVLPLVGPQDGELVSYATAINDAGTVVGSIDRYESGPGAFTLQVSGAAVRWDASGAAAQLQTPAPTHGHFTQGVPGDINAAGTTVGAVDEYEYFYSDDGPVPYVLGSRALRWDASGTSATQLANLGAAPNGFADTGAYAINSAGSIVGYATKYGPGALEARHAAYWGGDGAAVDLNSLIDPASGWLLTSAHDISDTGWIAGIGNFDPDGAGGENAHTRHFLLQLSEEPAILAGDFNGDSVVDAADLVQWKAGFGASGSATRMQGDAEGDHDVDGADFLTWQRQLGGPAAFASSGAVPEPASLFLLGSGAAALALFLAQSRRQGLELIKTKAF